MVWNSFGLSRAVALSGYLLGPSHAYRETVSQRFVRALTPIIGRQILTAQIIPIGFPHIFFAAELHQKKQYTLFPKLL
jgi:hypothetical protein